MTRGRLPRFGIPGVGFCICLCSVLLSACSPHRARGGDIVVSYWDARGGDTAEAAYDTKFTVTLDGVPAGESRVADRYAHKTLSLRAAPGAHLVVVEGMALKNGAWEKRTAANGYLYDHRLEKKVDLENGGTTAVNFLVPDRREHITIKLGKVPTPPAQPGAESDNASR